MFYISRIQSGKLNQFLVLHHCQIYVYADSKKREMLVTVELDYWVGSLTMLYVLRQLASMSAWLTNVRQLAEISGTLTYKLKASATLTQ